MRRQAARTLASSLLANKCFFPGKESFAVHLIGSNPRLEYSIDNSCIMRTSIPWAGPGCGGGFHSNRKTKQEKEKKNFFFWTMHVHMYCTRIITWSKTGVLLYVLDYDDVTYIS